MRSKKKILFVGGTIINIILLCFFWMGSAECISIDQVLDGNEFVHEGEGRWFTAGVYQYYMCRKAENYDEEMKECYDRYIEVFTSGNDVPLDSIRDENPDNLEYTKGALVAYMLDSELDKVDHNLLEVIRLIYEQNDIKSERNPTNEELLSALSVVSGDDFDNFFDSYVYGIEKLPLDGSFDWIYHDFEEEIRAHDITSAQTGPCGAAAAYGATGPFSSRSHSHLNILRNFRDHYLINNFFGKKFVDFYYKHSPAVASFISKHKFMKNIVKVGLYPFVAFSSLMLVTNTFEKIILFLVLMAFFAGLVIYFKRNF